MKGRARTLTLLVAAFGALALLLLACSAVPDISFADTDAGPDGSTSPSDAARDADAAPLVSCPSNPPPAGTCCGAQVCASCAGPADCIKCGVAACAAPQICCAKGPKVSCVATIADCK